MRKLFTFVRICLGLGPHGRARVANDLQFEDVRSLNGTLGRQPWGDDPPAFSVISVQRVDGTLFKALGAVKSALKERGKKGGASVLATSQSC